MVVTAVGAIPDFVKDGRDGFLVRPHEPASLAEKINLLLNDEELRRGIANYIRERASMEFSLEVNASAVRTCIQDIVRR